MLNLSHIPEMLPLVVCSTQFYPSGLSVEMGPTCVLMVKSDKMPLWAGNQYDSGVLDIDWPDDQGRIAELNTLIHNGDANVCNCAKYVHSAVNVMDKLSA